MSTLEKLKVERRYDDQLLHLTLSAPKANLLDSAMLGEIRAALEEYGEQTSLKAIVFEGSGTHFSFGASVQEHTAERAATMLSQFHGLFRQLAQLSVPTIAVVRGQCLGGGLELAAYCTWVFAAPDAWLGQPEISLGVFPPLASVLLPWRIGAGAAMNLCVSGLLISAEEALRVGLVSAVGDDPSALADEHFTADLMTKSASSLRFAETAVRVGLQRALRADLAGLEELYIERLMATHDANEGISAFLECRPPRFTNR